MKQFIILFILSILLVGCSADTTEVTTYATRNYSEFSNLMIENPSSQLNQSEEEYYIYFYGLACTACSSIKNEVLSKIELLESTTIYLVEVNGVEDISNSVDITYTPAIVKIVGGEVSAVYEKVTAVLNLLNELP